MKRSQLLFGIILAAIVISGCKDLFPPAPDDPKPITAAWQNITWHLVSYEKSNGTIVKVRAEAEANIRFSDTGSFGGYSGCNAFGGDYTHSDSTIDIGQIWQTERYCADLNDLEIAFFAGLCSALPCRKNYKVTQTTFHIYGTGDVVALNFSRDCDPPDPASVKGIVYNTGDAGSGAFNLVRLWKQTLSPVGIGRLSYPPVEGMMAFWSPEASITTRPMVIVANVDGSGRRVVFGNDASSPFSPVAGSVAISPAQQLVVYCAENMVTVPPFARCDLYLVTFDGTNEHKIGDGVVYGSQPAFSPDGGSVAWYGIDGNVYISTTGIATVAPRTVADNGVQQLTNPDAWLEFSPDGRTLAYVGVDPSSSSIDLFTVSINGGSPKNITRDAADDAWPVWSPDGSKIASVLLSDNDSRISIIASDGSSQRQFPVVRPTDPLLYDHYPQWSPDGDQLLLTSYKVRPTLYAMGELLRVGLATGEMVTVSKSAWRGFWER